VCPHAVNEGRLSTPQRSNQIDNVLSMPWETLNIIRACVFPKHAELRMHVVVLWCIMVLPVFPKGDYACGLLSLPHVIVILVG
jgi:hypothetical protein